MSGDFEPGRAFGKYRLLEKIGAGGMAEIYKASVAGPDGFEKILVVKKILPAYAQNQAFIRMLVAEAKVSSCLQHANIVQIFELGEIEGQYYIAMEYVNGADLLHILTECTKRGVKPETKLVLYIVSEICKGLAYAHDATDTNGRPLHIIHRDVSPSNILISRQGDVKIMDFGVARADLERASEERKRNTQSGVLKGKLGYMSCEQVVGSEIDRRSDIFALGIMLFECLTLKRLFLGKTDLETLINIRDVKIEGKLQKHAYIPKPIQQILRTSLAKNVGERYRTASDFQEAILDYLFERRERVSSRDLAEFVTGLLDDSAALPKGSSPAGLAPKDPTPEEVPDAGPPTRDGKKKPANESTRALKKQKEEEAPPPLPAEGLAAADAEDRSDLAAGETSPPAPEIAVEESGLLARAAFRIRSPAGDEFGPVTLANLRSLARSLALSADEELQVDGGGFRRLGDAASAAPDLAPDVAEVLADVLAPLLAEPADAPRFDGPVSQLVTPRILFRIAVEKLDGALRMEGRGVVKRVFFQNGAPHHITSTSRDELLGAFLADRRLASKGDIDRGLDASFREGGRLGDALVRLGVMKSHDLFRVLELQFRQKFLELFRWREGWYEFFDGVEAPDDAVWMGNDTMQLLTAGIRTQLDLPTLEDIFRDSQSRVLALQSNPHITHNNFRFNSKELRSYSCLESGHTLGQTLERHGRTEEERTTLLQVVYVLHQTELLRLQAPRAGAR